MLVKSLTTKIKSTSKKLTTYYCKIGEKLAIISKPGDFYIVINVRNEVFTLLESEISDNNYIEPIIAFNINHIPLFSEYILPKFEL